MKHFTVQELEISKYKSITGPREEEVVGGSRPRLTLFHKDKNQKFFFKTYTHNTREVWAECLASHIAEVASIKAQAVTIKIAPPRLVTAMHAHYKKILPKDWQPIGTLARNIFPRHIDITYGSVVVETPSDALTLAQIEDRIRARYYAADDLLQAYADMVVFDVFIGNMDRHHENWGVCEHKRYKQQRMFDRKEMIKLRYFTPLFDHGSSLMFELSDEDVAALLADPVRLENYVAGSKFGFLLNMQGKSSNPFDVIAENLEQSTSWKPRFMKALAKIYDIDLLQVSGLIIKMPALDVLEYDDRRRQLLYKSLLLRYNKLNELYEKG